LGNCKDRTSWIENIEVEFEAVTVVFVIRQVSQCVAEPVKKAIPFFDDKATIS